MYYYNAVEINCTFLGTEFYLVVYFVFVATYLIPTEGMRGF